MPIVIGAGNIDIGWNFDFSIIQRMGCTCTQERNSDGMNRRSQSTRRWVPSNTQVAKNFECRIFGINPRIAHRYYWLLFIVILGGHHPWLHKSLHRHSFSEQGSSGQEIAWLSLNFILYTSWVALSSIVCQSVSEASVSPDQISTFSNIYRHTSPLLTQYNI